MKKSLSILLLIFVMIVVLRLAGFTYGYYAANIHNNTGSHSVSVISKNLSVEYLDGTSIMNFDGDYLFPGDSAEKTFMIKNTSVSKSTYNILIDNVLNEFERTQDLRYVLYINDEEVTSGAINNNSIQYLYSNKEINSGATDSVRFVFKYATTDEIQNVDMNKTISFRFNIDSNIVGLSEGTTISLLANQNVNNYRIYGNSVQNGTPSINTSVEIESVGDLVTDGESEYYNKYKIPVKVSGKNLFSLNSYEGIVDWVSYDKLTKNSVKVEPNTNYTLSFQSFERIDANTGGNIVIYVYNNSSLSEDNNGRVADVIINSDGNTEPSLTSKTINSGNNTELYFIIRNNLGKQTNIKIDGLMLEKGNDATNYEPYVEPVTTNIYLDEPLRKIGDYADYIDFKEQKVYRNVGEYIFTGSENDMGGVDVNSYVFGITVKIPNSARRETESRKGLNNYLPFKYVSGSHTSDAFGFWGADNHPYVYLYFAKSSFPEYSNFSSSVAKTILKSMYDNGNPMKLQYVLNTPVEKNFKLQTLNYEQRSSLVEIDTKIKPSNFEIEWIK